MPSGLEADEESPLRFWDASADTDDQDDAIAKAGICINSDVPHMVESAFFSGHVLFYVEGLPSSPARLFKGHKRRSHLIVKVSHKHPLKADLTCATHMPLQICPASSKAWWQKWCVRPCRQPHEPKAGVAAQGRFKQPVSYEDAVTGQRFDRPLKRLPSPWFLEFVLMLARQLSPSMQIGCQEAPYILSPMISTAQVMLTCDPLASIRCASEGSSLLIEQVECANLITDDKLWKLHARCQPEADHWLLFRRSMWRTKVTAAELMPSLWKTCAL